MLFLYHFVYRKFSTLTIKYINAKANAKAKAKKNTPQMQYFEISAFKFQRQFNFSNQ